MRYERQPFEPGPVEISRDDVKEYSPGVYVSEEDQSRLVKVGDYNNYVRADLGRKGLQSTMNHPRLKH